MVSLFNPPAVASMLLYSFSTWCRNCVAISREQGRDARGEGGCAKRDQVIVEIVAFGDDDGGFNAGVRAVPVRGVRRRVHPRCRYRGR